MSDYNEKAPSNSQQQQQQQMQQHQGHQSPDDDHDDDEYHGETLTSPARSTSRERKKKLPQKLNNHGSNNRGGSTKKSVYRSSASRQSHNNDDDDDDNDDEIEEEYDHENNDLDDDLDESYSPPQQQPTSKAHKVYKSSVSKQYSVAASSASLNARPSKASYSFKQELKSGALLPKIAKKSTNNLNLAGHAFGYEVDPVGDKVDLWGHLLIGISYFVLIFSFPFSLCACVKVGKCEPFVLVSLMWSWLNSWIG